MVDNQFIWAPWKASQKGMETKGLWIMKDEIVMQNYIPKLKSRNNVHVAPAVFTVYILYISIQNKESIMCEAKHPRSMMDGSLLAVRHGRQIHFQTSMNRPVNWSSMRPHVGTILLVEEILHQFITILSSYLQGFCASQVVQDVFHQQYD